MDGYLKNLKLNIDLGNLEDYKKERIYLISCIMTEVNRTTLGDNFVLKGGTGLLLCHGLDRFSEDIDLDGIRKVDIGTIIFDACSKIQRRVNIKISKDTDTVLRYMVDYGSILNRAYPLKIEISFRNKTNLAKGLNTVEVLNGLRVYSLKDLLNMKLVAFMHRDKARDFYDLAWMVSKHPQIITPSIAAQLLESLNYKGHEEMQELLKEEMSADHILREVDTEKMMLDFMYELESILNGKRDTKNMDSF